MARIPRLAKAILAGLGIALLVVVGYLAYGGYKLKLQSERAARTRGELDIKYHGQLVQYQRDLSIGMSRSDVRKYLDSHQVPYNEGRGDIAAILGDEPDAGVCNWWRVYVSLEFTPRKESETSPLDRLAQISLQRIGHCL